MSADLPPPENASDAPPGITGEPEPFLAELAEDEHVLTAELVEPDEVPPRRRPPLRRRVPARPRPPGPPHPGFWWAIAWCVLMLIVAQIIPTVIIVVGAVVWTLVRRGPQGVDEAAAQQIQKDILLPTVLTNQVALILFSLLVLRLVVGRDWRREVALRLPAVTHVVLAVLLWPALALTASGIYQAASHLPGLSHILSYLVTVCATLGVVGVCWCVVRLATGRDWTKVLVRQRPTTQLLVVPVGCLVVVGVAAQIFALVNLHLPSFGSLDSGLMEEVVKQFREWPPLAAVLIVGLGPGLGEELWCRAFLGRGLVGRHGPVMGVVLASCFFGAIHGDPHQGTMAAIMGLVLHFSYLMTRSLWVPMLLHFLNNSLSVIGDKLEHLPGASGERMKDIDTNPDALPWLVVGTAACVVVAVGWALYSSRGRLVRVDGTDAPPWQPPFPGVAHPPEGSDTAVVYPWPGLLPTLAVIVAVGGLAGALVWG